jgi:hypothetical protein
MSTPPATRYGEPMRYLHLIADGGFSIFRNAIETIKPAKALAIAWLVVAIHLVAVAAFQLYAIFAGLYDPGRMTR